jgi:cell division protease FtsH
MKPKYRIAIYIVLLLLIGVAVYSLFAPTSPNAQTVAISQVSEQVQHNEVNKIVVEGDKLTVYLKNNQQEISYKEDGSNLSDYKITPDKVSIEAKSTSGTSTWINLLSAFLPVLLIIGFFYFIMRQAQGGANQALSFGRSKPQLVGERQKVTFKDAAGVDEAKQELLEVVEFLKHPRKFLALGAQIPKGVLLMGAPGSGKTLLAKAVAGEASVPFFSISGSEFVEMFVGVGASRVRDLFDKAKKNSPCIIFIDEIDAVGRQRGTGLGGSHDEREQTLNQILVEMDGMGTDVNVIVIAATNRPDILDPALLRPGRFDRRIILDLPDIKARQEILDIHLKNKPVNSSANLKRIAERTSGFSGADLKNLANEAAILAARRDKKVIEMSELEEAVEKVLLGPERKSRVLSDKEKRIAAYHESGHALVSQLLPQSDPVHKVSIISRGAAGGYTLLVPSEDKHIHSLAEFKDKLAGMLGGRAAEEVMFKEMTTGAEADLREATQLARKMITEYGMSEKLGPRTFGEKEELVFLGRELGEKKDYSDEIAFQIDEEVRRIVNDAHAKAREVLSKHKKKLVELAEKLIKKETIESEELTRILPQKHKNNK